MVGKAVGVPFFGFWATPVLDWIRRWRFALARSGVGQIGGGTLCPSYLMSGLDDHMV